MPPSISLPDPLCEFPSVARFSAIYSHLLSDWQPRREPNGKFLYLCTICRDGRERPIYHVARHEANPSHQNALAAFREHTSASNPTQSDVINDAPGRVLTDDAFRQLLSSLTSNPAQHPAYPPSSSSYGEPNFPNAPQSAEGSRSHTNLNWLAFSALEDSVAESTPYDEMRDYLAQKGLDIMNGEAEMDGDCRSDVSSHSGASSFCDHQP